ncbi:MAG TPA: hypothetical protein VGK30_06650 [Candidatus Binatia bacterium]
MSDERSARAEGPRAILLALLGAVIVLAGLQFVTPNLIGNDSYFHVRYAEVIREAGLRGFPPPFPWLPLTILAPDRYADHHMLFHVWLVPFTLGDLRLGGKLAGLAGAALFVATFAWFLRRQGVGLVALAILALGASSADLLFRLNMTRVQALSLVCLLAGFHCALTDRKVALAIVGCLYAWLYDGFPLLFLPVGATFVASWVCEGRFRPGIVLAAAAGVLVGVVCTPYFPAYFQFILHHFGDKLVPDDSLRVGREWFPYDPAELLANALPAMLYVAFGASVLGAVGFRRNARGFAALLVAMVFLVLTLRSKRFVEYFAPTATVFVALASWRAVAEWPRPRRLIVTALLAAVAATNVGGVGWTLLQKQKETPPDRYAAAARYVAQHAPAGAMLCTTDWDDFPWIYFYNVKSTYLVGLDPTYLHDRYRDAYRRWAAASDGSLSRPSQVFGQELPCAYVLSDRDHAAFLERASQDPGFLQVLTDEQMVLYRVERDGPPPVYPTSLP